MSSMGIQLLPQQLVPLMPILDAMSDGVLSASQEPLLYTLMAEAWSGGTVSTVPLFFVPYRFDV